MALSKSDVIELVRERLWPAFQNERDRLERVDKWLRWEHEPPHQPRQSTREYQQLRDRSQAPWLSLIVTAVAQNLYVDGYRPEGSTDNGAAWDLWQTNGMDARQIAIHRAALGYGHAYVSVTPGQNEIGEPAPVIRGHSPRRVMCFYLEPEVDDWAAYALRATPQKEGFAVRLYDEQNVYYLNVDDGGTPRGDLGYRDEEHGIGRVPFVRFANQLDLEGRTPGEVEPLIPIAGRIDQTTFDRLVVQRFSAWVVRTISGMSKPEEDEDAEATRLRLKVEDLLIAEDTETKFGSLPATPLDGFIKAAEHDVHVLAAASQTPAYELLGQMVNLSAEALEAARAGLNAKVDERQQVFGESHEQVLRLASWVAGDREGAADFGAQVQWRDTEIRSLAQASDALGKMATMLGLPVELLWERIPGFTPQDIERAKGLLAEGDAFAELTALLNRQEADADAGSAGPGA